MTTATKLWLCDVVMAISCLVVVVATIMVDDTIGSAVAGFAFGYKFCQVLQ